MVEGLHSRLDLGELAFDSEIRIPAPLNSGLLQHLDVLALDALPEPALHGLKFAERALIPCRGNPLLQRVEIPTNAGLLQPANALGDGFRLWVGRGPSEVDPRST